MPSAKTANSLCARANGFAPDESGTSIVRADMSPSIRVAVLPLQRVGHPSDGFSSRRFAGECFRRGAMRAREENDQQESAKETAHERSAHPAADAANPGWGRARRTIARTARTARRAVARPAIERPRLLARAAPHPHV